MFNTLGTFAEFEIHIRGERQQDEIAKAQTKGVKFERKAVLTNKQQVTIQRLRAKGRVHHLSVNGTLPGRAVQLFIER